MKREERLAFISDLIEKEEVKTQDDLVESFTEAGVTVTQATISRDIKSLALVKIPSQTGGYCYALPQKAVQATTDYASDDFLADMVFQAKIKDEMISITAKPGTTAVIKRELVARFDAKELFSILNDDDSLLVIASSKASAKKIYQALND
ncbi:arginine repressor [Lactococcus termiticola]|uniref:Arginine repressor n=1 Tax=Lactococcus termiticola TaxID=2169526 RepID=A0A2R5HFU8_9LACT|nr:transcriptional regulator [Lactococcus termiticola]GBG96205.1 arginine repressor [Lactococcus termiticola]